MLQGLQVSFRGLPPNESLVNLADDLYRELVSARPELAECLVWLDAPRGASSYGAHAIVRTSGRELADAEAHAHHRDPHTALSIALTRLRARIGLGGSLRARPWLATRSRSCR